ncbi:MAG: hypothetical protein BMS9Abin29_0992 [Gemmatimonadota bacterium]|nr:MAG: hypothetical protein BMS9Abin29_0992 [Gemmatimonadota bacterium]
MTRHSAIAAALMLFLSGCGDGSSPDGPDPPDLVQPRTYAMGWAPAAPRPEIELILRGIDSMAVVSDMAIVQNAVPWEPLLAGAAMDSLVQDRAQLTDLLASKGLELIFLVDPLDGLDRTREADNLLALGRSILEPEIRQLHDEWVRQITARVRPTYMGLASEINTLAALGDPVLYAEILAMINSLAPQIRQISPGTQVFVSFQADQANGRLGPTGGIDHFALIDQFDIDALGLSSYPGFVFDDPSEVPDDYFSVFDDATDLPLLMVEGGWSSADVPWSAGTPQQQVDFFTRFETLLDGVDAVAWVMLTFTDLDIGSLGLTPERALTLSNFAHMGILDSELRRKPSYAEWERIFERPLR